MSGADLVPLLPFLILLGAIAATLGLSAYSRGHALMAGVTGLGLAAAFIALVRVRRSDHVASLLAMDSYAAFYVGLIIVSALAVTLLSYDYLRDKPVTSQRAHEYYVLVLLATLGSAVLAASTHFASFFLGLEILSVSLYALISYRHQNLRGSEAGIKYLVLAGTSSSFILFGMAMIYGSLGTMDFARIAPVLVGRAASGAVTLIGSTMILVGIGFKLAFAPFHLWTPDIYEGAPAPVGAFIATISKGAVFALLTRYLVSTPSRLAFPLVQILMLLAFLSMTAGNLLALRQNNIKRLLAYSSIAHLGYLLVALIAGVPVGQGAIAFYLLSYFVTTLLAFGIISVLSSPEREADELTHYEGLFWRRPFLAGVFSASLLSLAGIPLTAGFVGKYYVVLSGVGAGLWTLVMILILNSVLGLSYYLRIVVAMFSEPVSVPERPQAAVPPSLRGSGLACLVTLAALLLWLGVYPPPFLALAQATVSNLVR